MSNYSEPSRVYWHKALEIIDAWAKYQSKKKLYINATHKETYYKVKHIIDKHYGGDVKRLIKQEHFLSEKLDRELKNFNIICSRYSVKSVDRNWLFNNLKEARDYEKFRQKCKRRLKNKKPAESLREI